MTFDKEAAREVLGVEPKVIGVEIRAVGAFDREAARAYQQRRENSFGPSCCSAPEYLASALDHIDALDARIAELEAALADRQSPPPLSLLGQVYMRRALGES